MQPIIAFLLVSSNVFGTLDIRMIHSFDPPPYCALSFASEYLHLPFLVFMCLSASSSVTIRQHEFTLDLKRLYAIAQLTSWFLSIPSSSTLSESTAMTP
ncbi:hypothetical protein BDV98DRAFT_420436 [Pterulicium gracile]|uniref:Uncharacterized protein n=1 Tax=Pterulicium gracile TaxID=1884261 RepID=A0A5C3PZL9_9AGAR|nr:hypothetical protein BDV98DRAFT_420436 [Pterula gracilis]